MESEENKGGTGGPSTSRQPTVSKGRHYIVAEYFGFTGGVMHFYLLDGKERLATFQVQDPPAELYAEVHPEDRGEPRVSPAMRRAAPDLFAALEGVVSDFSSFLRSDYATTANPDPAAAQPALVQARAALAKARGE